MALMTPIQIRRMQILKKLLQSPDSGIVPAQIPQLTKELEKLKDQFADEEFVSSSKQTNDE